MEDGPGAISRGFVSGLLEQNPTMLAETLEGMSYLAPDAFRDTLQEASLETHNLSVIKTNGTVERVS